MRRLLISPLLASLALPGLAVLLALCPSLSAADGEAPQTLRRAVNGRFLIGTAVMSRQLDNSATAELVARQFNCVTAENEFKPQSLQPQPGKFRFDAADKIVDFAQRHDMKVVGHNLCWHSQTPAWMFRDDNGKPLSRDEALRNLKAHIDAVVGHFKGMVIGWDVVNEAISERGDDYLRDTPARRAIGDDFIVKAFEFAHAADPDAKLYYNDYSNENPEKLKKTVRLIRELKAKGAHLDAIGMQCHFRLEDADAPDRLDKAIRAYADEGVKVMITELDVDVLPRRGCGADADPYAKGLPADVAAAQARFYERVFEVVLKHSKVVTRVTLWGTHDGASWLNGGFGGRRTNYPLLFDRDLKPKPAVRAVLDALAAP
jgi:endo-1,4-beta-xylanase